MARHKSSQPVTWDGPYNFVSEDEAKGWVQQWGIVRAHPIKPRR